MDASILLLPLVSDRLHDPSLQEEQPGYKGVRPVMRTAVGYIFFTMKFTGPIFITNCPGKGVGGGGGGADTTPV